MVAKTKTIKIVIIIKQQKAKAFWTKYAKNIALADKKMGNIIIK